MDKIKIGNYLKDLRKKKRRVDGKPFTQADLSDALASAGLDVSINGINEWESGKSLPSPEKLDFLSKIIIKLKIKKSKDTINNILTFCICSKRYHPRSVSKLANACKIKRGD